jgi:hypothetical protein
MAKRKEQSGTLDLFAVATQTTSRTEDESRKKTKDKPVDTEQKVYCADCEHFERDTSGISRTVDGEYFMGIYTEGLHPDSPIKQFADKAKKCETYKNKDL